jgi:hypothetical protein
VSTAYARSTRGSSFKWLHRSLDGYRDNLKPAGWDSDLWKNLRKKMERVCANCGSKAPGLV